MRIQPNSQDSEPSPKVANHRTTYKSTKWLVFEYVPLLFIIILPLSVHAGVFASFIGALEEKEAQPARTESIANAQTLPLLKAALHTDPNPAKGGGDVIVEDGSLVPDGRGSGADSVNTRTSGGEISVYVVREADTLSQIAEMFDVSANTILWANDIARANLIKPGDTLVILPITGVRHIVKDGDTLASIASKYDGDEEDILAYNQLTSAEDITIGDTIVIPGGAVEEAPKPSRRSAPVHSSGSTVVVQGGGSSGFINPLSSGVRSQGIHGYNGVDIAAPAGTPIVAAQDGEVIISKGTGWNGGYGNYVVLKHANGTQTLYAHMSSNAVSAGQSVSAGSTVGYVGNTGRSTGSHLHFEVRGARNPF